MRGSGWYLVGIVGCCLALMFGVAFAAGVLR